MTALFTNATLAEHLAAATVSVGIVALYLLATFIARTAADAFGRGRR